MFFLRNTASSTLEMKVCGEFEEFSFLESILKEYGVCFEKGEYGVFQGVSNVITLIFPKKLQIMPLILNQENEKYDEWRQSFHEKIILAYQNFEEELLQFRKKIENTLCNDQEKTFFSIFTIQSPNKAFSLTYSLKK